MSKIYARIVLIFTLTVKRKMTNPIKINTPIPVQRYFLEKCLKSITRNKRITTLLIKNIPDLKILCWKSKFRIIPIYTTINNTSRTRNLRIFFFIFIKRRYYNKTNSCMISGNSINTRNATIIAGRNGMSGFWFGKISTLIK